MSNLNNIILLNTKLFNIPESIMYKFCVDNNLFTLKELVDYINHFGINLDNNLDNDEILGIVDLLRYKYSYIDLKVMNILSAKFAKNDFKYTDEKIDWSCSEQVVLFRRLGFNNDECKSFILFANSIDNELTVGDMLSLYYEQFKGSSLSYYEPLIQKTLLLVAFYKNNSLMYSDLEYLKNLYNELADGIKRKNMIGKEISNKKDEKDLDVVSVLKENEDLKILKKRIDNMSK